MSLRRQSLSPTANLLRNSRLFALPNPLPRPSVAESFGSGSTKESDSATIPYPTHQAIATTPSSAARGDWGLKRPLPKRSRILQTSNPVVRIKQWDSIEHITDFDSATDHVRTRQKFEELNIPLLKGLSHFRDTDLTYTPPKSAFEKRADITSYDVEDGLDGAAIFLRALKESRVKREQENRSTKKAMRKAKESGEKVDESFEAARFTPFTPPSQEVFKLSNPRWKNDGPWLPGMSATEFTSYLSKEISKRKNEFSRYLVEFVKGQIYTTRRHASSQAETIPIDAAEAEAFRQKKEKEWSNITAADVSSGITALRAQCAKDPLTSDLVNKLIIPFLRLPPMKLKSTEFGANPNSKRAIDSYRFSDDTTPASTHPSAGLSYLRTKAFLSNHPILGPQALPTPITSRVVQPRQTSNTTETTARLGVAGFVTEDEHSKMTSMATRGSARFESGIQTLDVDTHGGKKVPVQPQFASVSPDGKVFIKVKRSNGPELAVSRGQLEDKPPEREGNQTTSLNDLRSGRSGIPELDAQVGLSEETASQGADQFFNMLKDAGVKEQIQTPPGKQ
ncbi:hypothetical protein BU24DRAFT_418816 [Aaosphaeria arxii CBS 175.79]|uniref:Uncharacterized protein n=1 Tax=Aaosphaeria arxii CBS 175.79 TaxID=1450172 RepID=A0A6A5Y351_9PLEO|nr:uncharacterized protein BU24DRAFT_418816 [Aaosphaeria arxii CBS 175.79]KAF2019230.1 hypothetical protein BU24DRAFT_418816 [Aaosphaeria arxii CBS 175.79]